MHIETGIVRAAHILNTAREVVNLNVAHWV